MKYTCYRCFYETERKSNMINHTDKKKEQCDIINTDAYLLSDEKIYEKTFQKKTNNFSCDECDYNTNRKPNLERHKLKHNNKSKVNEKNGIVINADVININQNININLCQKIVPFDMQWDVMNFDSIKKRSHLSSINLMTELLEEILKNNKNLNVILDKNKERGLVYKNDNEKYIYLDKSKIIDQSMEKLNIHLKIFLEETLCIINNQIISILSKNIDTKYENYCNNKEIKKIVEGYISNIFDSVKEEANKKYIDVLDKSGY